MFMPSAHATGEGEEDGTRMPQLAAEDLDF